LQVVLIANTLLALLAILLLRFGQRAAERWFGAMSDLLAFCDGDVGGAGCRDFALGLLRDAGVDFRVVADPWRTGGLCDFARRQVVLSWWPEARTALALFEAAHEAGHAVLGPGLFGARRRLVMLAAGGAFLGCLTAGIAGAGWLALAVSCLWFGLVEGDWLRGELRTTRFAREKLLALFGGELPAVAARRVRMDGPWKGLAAAGKLLLFAAMCWFFLGFGGLIRGVAMGAAKAFPFPL